jgi:hypothetical protein
VRCRVVLCTLIWGKVRGLQAALEQLFKYPLNVTFVPLSQVHGESAKAAEWLAPLAVAKLSPEDATLAAEQTTPERHVERRMALLVRGSLSVTQSAETRTPRC